METLFNGVPIVTTVFYSADLELAYVVLEDEGDYWSILISLGEDIGGTDSTQQVIDKDIRHHDPKQYVNERYESAVNLVRQLLEWNGKDGITQQEERRW